MPDPPSVEALARAPNVDGGRLALVSRIGMGGMGGVYAAWDRAASRWRAVKVLLPEHARNKRLRRRFRQEAETMMGLEHANLVEVLSVHDHEALPYLVMELLTGGSLQDWVLKHGPMPPGLATHAATQLCLGLAEVHRQGIVHRDIKPNNVLITQDGHCKLTDFGMARVREGTDTKTGAILGTVGFMAPEQLTDSKSVDGRADIYGVGATLCVLLEPTAMRDFFRVADDPGRLEHVPAELATFLVDCLQYDRADRIANIDTALARLVALANALPANPDSTPPLPRPPRSGPPGAHTTDLSEILELIASSSMEDTELDISNEDPSPSPDRPAIPVRPPGDATPAPSRPSEPTRSSEPSRSSEPTRISSPNAPAPDRAGLQLALGLGLAVVVGGLFALAVITLAIMAT